MRIRGSGASGGEHDPPRTFENDMTDEEIEQNTAKILSWYSNRASNPMIYQQLQTPTKRLGERGKENVRTIIKRHEKEQDGKLQHANDAQQLFTRLR
eukprot:g8783.t2